MEKSGLPQTWVMYLDWKENVHPSFPMFKEDQKSLDFSAATFSLLKVSTKNHNYVTQLT